MNGEQMAMELLKLAVAAAPSVASLLQSAVTSNPSHPLAEQVGALLPATGASEQAARDLTKG